jgi:hypothetical protein
MFAHLNKQDKRPSRSLYSLGNHGRPTFGSQPMVANPTIFGGYSPKSPFLIFTLPSPIYWVMPLSHITLKTAVFPILHTLYILMLDWVVMNVINIPLQIIIISNLVFPKPALPYAFFSALGFAVAALLIDW